tara:strand:+ start:1038 stop:1205 length:168 start_codon:yes stop_codon:yes gene_type:complete
MRCAQCDAELIHGGSHDGEDYGRDSFLIINNYTCPKCGVFVLEHIPKEEEDKDDD